MAKLSAQQMTEKYTRRLKAALSDISTGVDKVSEAPGIRAAEKADKMRAKLLEKLDDGTWAERVSAVPLDEWKRKMKEKGVSRISAGVDAAQGDLTKFFGELNAHQDSYLPGVRDMPDVTLQDNIQRMIVNVEAMSRFRRGRR